MRRPFSRTRTSLSPNPRRIGRDGADPRLRTATPGRSEIFSAKLIPELFWNSTRDLDAVDWYCSSEVRTTGDAETTTSFSWIADSRRLNDTRVVPPTTLIVSVADAYPVTPTNTL